MSGLLPTTLRAVRGPFLAGVAVLVCLLGTAAPASAATAYSPVPSFTCAAANGDGTFTYFFGYSLGGSDSVTVPIGADTQLTSDNTGNSLSTNYSTSKQDRGQPTIFLPGAHPDAFSLTTSDTSLSWHLAGSRQKASSASLCSNVPVVAEAPSALVLPAAAAAPFAVWFLTMRRRSRRATA